MKNISFNLLRALSIVSLVVYSGFVEIGRASIQGADDVGLSRRISVVGIANFYTPSVNSTNANFSSLTNSSKLGTGPGILTEFSFLGPLQMELGFLVLNRQSSYSTSAFTYTQSSNALTVPVGLKFRFANYFSVGAGPYLSYRVGEVENEFSVGNAGSINFDTTAQARYELGYFASVGATLPVTPSIGITMESRLLRGLSNLSGDSSTRIESVDVVALLGLQFLY